MGFPCNLHIILWVQNGLFSLIPRSWVPILCENGRAYFERRYSFVIVVVELDSTYISLEQQPRLFHWLHRRDILSRRPTISTHHLGLIRTKPKIKVIQLPNSSFKKAVFALFLPLKHLLVESFSQDFGIIFLPGLEPSSYVFLAL